MNTSQQTELVIACDFQTYEQLTMFLAKLPPQKYFLKIGLELLYNVGFNCLQQLKQAHHRLFLDLKLFDTPNTVQQAVKAALVLQPDFITVHLNGGLAMLRAAVEATHNTNTKIIGVTTLTSLDYNDVVNIYPNYHGYKGADYIQMINMNLVTNAMMANIDHIVCAVSDAALIKNLEPHLKTFCPGISIGADVSQLTGQKRLAKLHEVHAAKVDYAIVGRALTLSDNPAQVYEQIKQTLENS